VLAMPALWPCFANTGATAAAHCRSRSKWPASRPGKMKLTWWRTAGCTEPSSKLFSTFWVMSWTFQPQMPAFISGLAPRSPTTSLHKSFLQDRMSRYCQANTCPERCKDTTRAADTAVWHWWHPLKNVSRRHSGFGVLSSQDGSHEDELKLMPEALIFPLPWRERVRVRGRRQSRLEIWYGSAPPSPPPSPIKGEGVKAAMTLADRIRGGPPSREKE